MYQAAAVPSSTVSFCSPSRPPKTCAAESTLHLQNFERFARGLAAFAGVAIPAAVVNSGLKYMQKRIQIAFQRRLTHHLHEQYCSNRCSKGTLGCNWTLQHWVRQAACCTVSPSTFAVATALHNIPLPHSTAALSRPGRGGAEAGGAAALCCSQTPVSRQACVR